MATLVPGARSPLPPSNGEVFEVLLDVAPGVDAERLAVLEPDPATMDLTEARRVVGAGRLYFHTAPDKQCQLSTVFVLPNDRLEAYAEHNGFTEVIYWNAKSRAGTAGWVVTARIAEVESASAPGAARTVVSSNSLR